MNARRNAGNFDAEELRRAVEYCHLRGVKVYQTINIVMFEDEIDEAVETIRTAAEAGVDAVLTQDLAVARMVRECAPTLPVHASTQMSIHNLEGARLCEELGFSRVVLARELTAAEIRHICENTPLEVEVFVHGALCMSVSGQCYLSSMIGGRSGNRGLCAQPCRLPFQAEGGKPYALSLKDLSLADRIAELTEMGVASLKIEGRMKRPEYVAAAVSAIRTACEGRPVDFETLRSVFSRSGFTKGYFDGRIDREMFGYRQKEDVTSAAGVLGELARLYDRENPLVPVSMRLEARAAQPTRLTVSDRDGHTFTVEGSVPQAAINKPTTPERAAQNLGKTGRHSLLCGRNGLRSGRWADDSGFGAQCPAPGGSGAAHRCPERCAVPCLHRPGTAGLPPHPGPEDPHSAGPAAAFPAHAGDRCPVPGSDPAL